jgi:cytolysin-activating lysine-acyltransferase
VVDSTTGRPISVVKTGDRLFTTPLIVGDVAYVGSPDKHVYVIDLIDGSVLNTIDVAGRVYAKPALLGGIVYVGTTGGKLVGIDPVSSTCRQVLQLPDHVLSAPLLVEDDTVLVVPVLGSRLIAFSAKGFSGGLATQAQPRRTAPRTKAPPLSSIVIETAQAEGLYFRMAEPVGRPVVRPYSSMPSRRLLGAAVMIMAHAPGFKDLTHSDLKARVMPALVASQARVFLYGLQPIGLVTWARLNEEAERLLKEQGQLPSGSDWTSGNRIWIIDVVAPFGGTRAMLTKVCRETLRGQTVNMLQPRASGGFEAITLSS